MPPLRWWMGLCHPTWSQEWQSAASSTRTSTSVSPMKFKWPRYAASTLFYAICHWYQISVSLARHVCTNNYLIVTLRPHERDSEELHPPSLSSPPPMPSCGHMKAMARCTTHPHRCFCPLHLPAITRTWWQGVPPTLAVISAPPNAFPQPHECDGEGLHPHHLITSSTPSKSTVFGPPRQGFKYLISAINVGYL